MGFVLRHLMEKNSYRERLKPLLLDISRRFDKSRRAVLICWSAIHLVASWHLKWPANSRRREKAFVFSVSLTLPSRRSRFLFGDYNPRESKLSLPCCRKARILGCIIFGQLARRSVPGGTLPDLRVGCRYQPRRYIVTTALFMEERSNSIGRNLIPERSQCLPEAIERESMMPGGGPLQRMSKCAKSGALTQTLLLQVIAVSWQETSTRHWTAIVILEAIFLSILVATRLHDVRRCSEQETGVEAPQARPISSVRFGMTLSSQWLVQTATLQPAIRSICRQMRTWTFPLWKGVIESWPKCNERPSTVTTRLL